MRAGDGILVIKLGALGDVILASSHIRSVVAAYPDARVTLMTAPAGAALLEGLPGLEVVVFERRGFVAMWRVIRWLRRRRFGVVYDLQGSLRSRIMALVSTARRRYGRRPGFAYTHVPLQRDDVKHAFDELNRLLELAGIEPAEPRPWLSIPESAGCRVRAWLSGHGLQGAQLVLMHAGSSEGWPSKRWEAAHFAALATELEGRGFRIIWLGSESERALNGQLARIAGLDATDVFSLPELVELGRRTAFALVNDSGPMHILSATGKPVYAFFGPTDWHRSHGLGQAERVLTHAVPCSPCHLPVCPTERQHRCLHAISPENVLSRLEVDGQI